ncbi:hypothetical protein TCAL_13680 [Tigriopus californicus]|uniref:FAS1 domain-containing protein n=1 Tax=Tigriopus californicus TaxID=6832 RepID=A0A553NFV0_TIGCA|nr:uncharacterized protein SYNPCC7002_A0175-like [Tigriopus californicus]TRY64291.1 hypothetical protein TCAL_13680 [Tigriopus californicus]|eukprot:TCALIF_13680-PA protein Name:"Similar to sll1735 Uncharacterized protein sll1735 (Synechocystis sp. (strain PCC 6803 / Kazusa))" AED:0.03 eAED:0.03 QI:46/1/1/1/1/1/2/52/185
MGSCAFVKSGLMLNWFMLLCSQGTAWAHFQKHASRNVDMGGVQAQFPPQGNILEVAQGGSGLGTLVFAIQTAELMDTLKEGGPYTIFAPNDQAFAKIDPQGLQELLQDREALTDTLLRHVVDGSRILASNINLGSSLLNTLGGEFVSVMNMDGNVTLTSSVGGARVIRTDIEADNGVIHIIDGVL